MSSKNWIKSIQQTPKKEMSAFVDGESSANAPITCGNGDVMHVLVLVCKRHVHVFISECAKL